MPSAKASEAAAAKAATAAPNRIADTPTPGYDCEASMAGTGRQRPAFPNTGYSRAKRLLAYFAARGISQREATSRAWTCHSAPFHANQAEKSASRLSAEISF
jgi:hypothetical protein